jgi:hypothetical protein
MNSTYNRLVKLLERCIEDPKLLLQNNASLSDEPTLPVKPENESLFTCNKEYDTITELALKRFCMFTCTEHYGPFNCCCADILTETQFLI